MGLTLNQKVLLWAQGKLGKKVGRGECWDLGESALKQAGAQTSNDLGPVDEDSDYVWGDPVSDLKDAQPGDILQLRDHVITTTTEKTYKFSDGSEEETSEDVSVDRPHHTAIVSSTLGPDGALKTIEQNIKPLGKIVQNKKLHTRDVPEVRTKKFEKRKHPSTGKLASVEVITKVSVSVSGSIWAYRPMKK